MRLAIHELAATLRSIAADKPSPKTLAGVARNFTVPSAVLERDVSPPDTSSERVTEAWRQVYLLPEQYRAIYDLTEKLIGFEDCFRPW